MKLLCILRHAKSTWADSTIPDIDRPLDSASKIQASSTGLFLKEKKIIPDALYSSPAKRAIDSANLIADTLQLPHEKIILEPRVYEAQVDDLLSVVQNFPDKFNSVMLIGHNPGLSLLANYLAGIHINTLPTSGLCCFELSTDHWQEITLAECKLLFTFSPHQTEE